MRCNSQAKEMGRSQRRNLLAIKPDKLSLVVEHRLGVLDPVSWREDTKLEDSKSLPGDQSPWRAIAGWNITNRQL